MSRRSTRNMCLVLSMLVVISGPPPHEFGPEDFEIAVPGRPQEFYLFFRLAGDYLVFKVKIESRLAVECQQDIFPAFLPSPDTNHCRVGDDDRAVGEGEGTEEYTLGLDAVILVEN